MAMEIGTQTELAMTDIAALEETSKTVKGLVTEIASLRKKIDSSEMKDPDDLLDTVPEILQYRSENDGDRKVFRFYDRHGLVVLLNPRDVYTLAGKFAHLLRSWGFQKGDVIANGLVNSPERVITDFGVIMSGCVLVNCQAIEKDGRDFWHTARISHCKGVILSARSDNAPSRIFSKFLPQDPTSLTKSSESASSLNIAHDVTVPEAPTIRKVIVCSRLSSLKKQDTTNETTDGEKKELLQGRANDEERSQTQPEQQLEDKRPEDISSFLAALKALDDETEFFQAECDPDDLALLLGTSGTTGFNKLVPQTHKNMLSIGRVFGKQGRDILNFNDRPLGWMGGSCLDYLASGTCRVLQDFFNNEGTKTPREFWKIVSASRCQGVALMPFDVIRLVDEFQHKPPEYKALYIVTGGQAIRQELSQALGLLCHSVVVGYGFTEGGSFSLEPIQAHQPEKLVDFYCGKINKADVEIRIVDEQGNPVEHGEVGEIYLRCERIAPTYYNLEAPAHPKILTEDGWYKTGDWGKLLADKSLFCYGRQGDVTSINGTIVYLSWLESILNKSPRITNSSVIAIGDDVDDRKKDGGGGVTFCGFVEPKSNVNLTEDDVKEFFLENLVDTHYKDKLKLSHVFIVDALPLIPTRKVNKRVLKQLARERMNLE